MLLCGALRPVHERSLTVELLRDAAVAYILTTGIVYLVLSVGNQRRGALAGQTSLCA